MKNKAKILSGVAIVVFVALAISVVLTERQKYDCKELLIRLESGAFKQGETRVFCWPVSSKSIVDEAAKQQFVVKSFKGPEGTEIVVYSRGALGVEVTGESGAFAAVWRSQRLPAGEKWYFCDRVTWGEFVDLSYELSNFE